MISLTTIPVLLLTWVAVENTRRSVEAQIIDANVTRIRWATQYLEEVLQRFDDLFYSLQIDENFIELLTASETLGAAAELGPTSPRPRDELVQRELVRLLTTSYYSYSGMVDQLTVYIHATGRALEIDNVTSGNVSRPDLDAAIWDGVLDEPIPLSIRRSDGELYAIHTINRFADQSFRGRWSRGLKNAFARRLCVSWLQPVIARCIC